MFNCSMIIVFLLLIFHRYGCCPDGMTAATGPNNEGCFECEGSGECDTCDDTKYGCCADGIRAATGPDQMGCEEIEGEKHEIIIIISLNFVIHSIIFYTMIDNDERSA